jgi:DNA-binding MarR family transcriptional regulator
MEFDRKTSFGWMINVIAGQAAKKLEIELKKQGLTIALWPTLMCLWEEEGVTQSEISAKSKVENSTTTRTLDKLENLGLVERRADPKSRRSFRIYLTKKGREIQKTISPLPTAVNQELLSSLDEAEQADMIRLLQKMVAAV